MLSRSLPFMAALLCTGCTAILTQELGIERYDQDQCLLAPLTTRSGAVLAVGTRGTFQEEDGHATFIVDNGSTPPTFYDITGQNWHMRSCPPPLN